MAVQRSMTTGRPPSWAMRAASQSTTPSWSHRAPQPVATAAAAIGGVYSGRRKTSTMSNGPVLATASSRVGKVAHPQHLAGRGVDRHALVAVGLEVAHHAVRRPAAIGRRADDGQPAGVAEEILRARLVQDRDGPAALMEVQDGRRPVAFGGPPRPLVGAVGHVVASRSYGLPSAAGGMLRPMTPARMMIVTTYGSASKNCGGSLRQQVAQLAVGRPDRDRLAERPCRRRTGSPPRTRRSASSGRRSWPPGR